MNSGLMLRAMKIAEFPSLAIWTSCPIIASSRHNETAASMLSSTTNMRRFGPGSDMVVR
jgi:hypothetical protein